MNNITINVVNPFQNLPNNFLTSSSQIMDVENEMRKKRDENKNRDYMWLDFFAQKIMKLTSRTKKKTRKRCARRTSQYATQPL
jgi:acetylglutamate synthase